MEAQLNNQHASGPGSLWADWSDPSKAGLEPLSARAFASDFSFLLGSDLGSLGPLSPTSARANSKATSADFLNGLISFDGNTPRGFSLGVPTAPSVPSLPSLPVAEQPGQELDQEQEQEQDEEAPPSATAAAGRGGARGKAKGRGKGAAGRKGVAKKTGGKGGVAAATAAAPSPVGLLYCGTVGSCGKLQAMSLPWTLSLQQLNRQLAVGQEAWPEADA